MNGEQQNLVQNLEQDLAKMEQEIEKMSEEIMADNYILQMKERELAEQFSSLKKTENHIKFLENQLQIFGETLEKMATGHAIFMQAFCKLATLKNPKKELTNE